MTCALFRIERRVGEHTEVIPGLGLAAFTGEALVAQAHWVGLYPLGQIMQALDVYDLGSVAVSLENGYEHGDVEARDRQVGHGSEQ